MLLSSSTFHGCAIKNRRIHEEKNRKQRMKIKEGIDVNGKKGLYIDLRTLPSFY